MLGKRRRAAKLTPPYRTLLDYFYSGAKFPVRTRPVWRLLKCRMTDSSHACAPVSWRNARVAFSAVIHRRTGLSPNWVSRERSTRHPIFQSNRRCAVANPFVSADSKNQQSAIRNGFTIQTKKLTNSSHEALFTIIYGSI